MLDISNLKHLYTSWQLEIQKVEYRKANMAWNGTALILEILHYIHIWIWAKYKSNEK